MILCYLLIENTLFFQTFLLFTITTNVLLQSHDICKFLRKQGRKRPLDKTKREKERERKKGRRRDIERVGEIREIEREREREKERERELKGIER